MVDLEENTCAIIYIRDALADILAVMKNEDDWDKVLPEIERKATDALGCATMLLAKIPAADL
jgi:hypothetical protein